ncbi:MAG: glycosyltransferase family 2 protein [Verrucomicrobiota bacterium]
MGIHKLSIVIPAYNETASIGALLQRVAQIELRHNIAKEIVVFNDGSTDGTDGAVRRFQWRYPALDVHYLAWPVNRGKGASLQAAAAVATGDMLVVQDADLEYDPSDYNRMLKQMGQHADVVYGSRFLNEAAATSPGIASAIVC